MWKRAPSVGAGCGGQEDERKRTAVDVVVIEMGGIKTGCYFLAWDESGGGPVLLARRCPAWRRREPDLRLLRGTWEGMPGHRRPRLFLRWLVVGRVSERMNREKDGVALPGMLADRLVVAVKLLSWGVERRGRLNFVDRGSINQETLGGIG